MVDGVAGEKFVAAKYSSGKVVISGRLFQRILFIDVCQSYFLFRIAQNAYMEEICICKIFIFTFMTCCRIKKTSVSLSSAVSFNNTDRMKLFANPVKSHLKLGSLNEEEKNKIQ